MVDLPFRLNLCPSGAPAVPGYINFAPAIYNAGLGYGYEQSPIINGFKRSTNLFTFPYDFDNAVWSKDTVTINPNVAAAPDGTLTADELVTGAVANKSVFQVGPTGASIANRTYTFSVWVRNHQVDRTIRLEIQASPPGSIFTQDFVVLREEGWRRIQMTATFPGGETATAMRALIRPSSGFTFVSTLIWGGKAIEGQFYQDDERYDTLHVLSGANIDDLRIDVPPGRMYDVLCAVGDVINPTAAAVLEISDAGSNPQSFNDFNLAANQFSHAGARILINNRLRIRINKIQGGASTTPVCFVTVAEAIKKGASLRGIGRPGTRRSITPVGNRRTP